MIKGLYIHIPFCAQICSYCDFCKMVASDELQKKYIDILLKEFMFYHDRFDALETIYIGGGTPTNIDIQLLDKLLFTIHKELPMSKIKEFTIEANPNDITEALAKRLKKYHVTRVSLGVQTIHKELLTILNRTHTKADVIKAVDILKANGISNINLDFIYGIPSQTKENLIEDITFIETINPSHISYYALIIEENTKLKHDIEKHKLKALEDDLVSDFSDLVKYHLQQFGFKHYETSNYAKPGYESLHNLLYWNLEEYLGIGVNASSQYDNHRYKNQRLISRYIDKFTDLIEEPFEPEIEYLLMGLRKIQGISLAAFKQRFNKEVFDVFPSLKKHIQQGLLVKKLDCLKLTDLGINLANQVYIDII